MPEKQLHPWITALVALLFALWGGASAYLHQMGRERRRFRWSEFLSKLVISGFSGQILVAATLAYGVPEVWVNVVAGMGGFLGAEAINLLKAALWRRVGDLPKSAGPDEAPR